MHWALGHAYSARVSENAESVARGAQQQARDSRREAKFLQERVDRLTLVCMAMWSLLKEVSELTDKDLDDRVNEIDMQDGKLDGKVRTAKVALCKKCNRKMAIRHLTCMYCGAPRDLASPFDRVM